MVDDELEPGPDPNKIRNPLARKPGRPPRVGDVLRSLDEDQAFSIRRATEAQAQALKSEITAAVYYLNTWEDYDVRVRPYVTEHYKFGDREYTFEPGGRKKTPRGWYSGDLYYTEAAFEALHKHDPAHYWKTTFWVHPPLPRGFRQMDKDSLEAAHRHSAASRGVTVTQGSGQRTRSVEVTDDDEARPARTVATRADIDRVLARLASDKRPRRSVQERD